MLSRLEKEHNMNIDDAYEEWQELLAFIPEFKDQERFLRHYYNAYKVMEKRRIDKYTRATKSNLIKIYEAYIKKDAKEIFEDLLEKAKIYNQFIEPEQYEKSNHSNSLTELNRIGASPSFLMLLFLYSLPNKAFVDKDNDLSELLDFLIKYYVRRNITDFPNTRNLDAINIEVIEKCYQYFKSGKKINSEFVINSLLTGKGKAADIKTFKENLEDNLYYYNAGMARYVLTKLDELSHSREYRPDLWARNPKGLLVWTIEHIFPQGNNIPDAWVEMVANGDKKEAKKIQEKWSHCLGNLTLSGYNSKLSNASFDDKQNLHENRKFLGHQINIGYKNGLAINNLKFTYDRETVSLSEIESWDLKAIKERNQVMVSLILRLFAFSNDEIGIINT